MDIWQASDDHIVPTDWSLGVIAFWIVVILLVLIGMAILLRRKK
jgi:hypothetical protein